MSGSPTRASIEAFDAPAIPRTNEACVASASSIAVTSLSRARSTSNVRSASPAQYHA